MGENMQSLNFWIWLTSLKMMFVSSIHLPEKWQNIILLYGWINFHCIKVFKSSLSWYLYMVTKHGPRFLFLQVDNQFFPAGNILEAIGIGKNVLCRTQAAQQLRERINK
jgi:hypothetical protein